MQKKLIRIALATSITLITFTGAGYWQLKSHLPLLMYSLLEKAKLHGFEISFDREFPSRSSFLELKQLKITGEGNPYLIRLLLLLHLLLLLLTTTIIIIII